MFFVLFFCFFNMNWLQHGCCKKWFRQETSGLEGAIVQRKPPTLRRVETWEFVWVCFIDKSLKHPNKHKQLWMIISCPRGAMVTALCVCVCTCYTAAWWRSPWWSPEGLTPQEPVWWRQSRPSLCGELWTRSRTTCRHKERLRLDWCWLMSCLSVSR